MKSLVQYIKEHLIISNNDEAINEMAIKLKKVREYIKDNLPMLVAHLCLCVYSKTEQNAEIIYNHWRRECLNYINDIIDLTPKSGDLNKAIKRVCIEFKCNDHENVLKLCRGKFKEEHISKDKQEELVETFVNHFDDFIDLLTTSNKTNTKEKLEDYVITIIPPFYKDDNYKF